MPFNLLTLDTARRSEKNTFLLCQNENWTKDWIELSSWALNKKKNGRAETTPNFEYHTVESGLNQ